MFQESAIIPAWLQMIRYGISIDDKVFERVGILSRLYMVISSGSDPGILEKSRELYKFNKYFQRYGYFWQWLVNLLPESTVLTDIEKEVVLN